MVRMLDNGLSSTGHVYFVVFLSLEQDTSNFSQGGGGGDLHVARYYTCKFTLFAVTQPALANEICCRDTGSIFHVKEAECLCDKFA